MGEENWQINAVRAIDYLKKPSSQCTKTAKINYTSAILEAIYLRLIMTWREREREREREHAKLLSKEIIISIFRSINLFPNKPHSQDFKKEGRFIYNSSWKIIEYHKMRPEPTSGIRNDKSPTKPQSKMKKGIELGYIRMHRKQRENVSFYLDLVTFPILLSGLK